MSETKFTPGPWEAADAGSFKDGQYVRDEVFVRRPEGDIAIASDILDPDTIKPSDANAHLIAAAPDLYDALTLLVNLGDKSIADDIRGALRAHERGTFDASIQQARAALAKADGREEG